MNAVMNPVQIEQKSYEMPPREGMSIAHFLTVTDIERRDRRGRQENAFQNED